MMAMEIIPKNKKKVKKRDGVEKQLKHGRIKKVEWSFGRCWGVVWGNTLEHKMMERKDCFLQTQIE